MELQNDDDQYTTQKNKTMGHAIQPLQMMDVQSALLKLLMF